MFNLDSFDNYEFLNISETNDIKTFNEKFWQADSADNDFSFVVKFDFENGHFSDISDKGIKLEGLPYECWTFDCTDRQGLNLFLSEDYEFMNSDFELLTNEQVKHLIITNITNYGKDPTLSDNPDKAVTELFMSPNHEIQKLGKHFKIIADSYVDLIEAKKTENSDQQSITQFPFKLYLRLDNRPKEPVMPIILDSLEDQEIGTAELDSLTKKNE